MPLVAEDLTRSVIGAFYEVYNELGFGFLEKVYAKALQYELGVRGHRVSREAHLPVVYKGMKLMWQRLDFVVDDVLAVEVKSKTRLPPDTSRQLLSYISATSVEVGLVLHFGPRPTFFRVVASNDRKRRSVHPPTNPGAP